MIQPILYEHSMMWRGGGRTWGWGDRRTRFLLVKRTGHIEQAHGFSPVWVRSCGATAPLLANRRGRIEQAYDLSPVWAARLLCSDT